MAIDIKVLFDGVDTDQFRPTGGKRPTLFRGVELPADRKVVTYASPGLESVRGFDVFMRAVRKLLEIRDDMIVMIAGEARSVYGHEPEYLHGTSFRDHVIDEIGGKPDNVNFLGMLPYAELNSLFNLSDVHVYLTIPYTLSWSMVQAMSAGCALVASDTAPVQEFVEHETHGLLGAFDDDTQLAHNINRLLDEPALAARLGKNARQHVLKTYSNKVCLPRLEGFLAETIDRYRSGSYA
jgi:glycosyltransferase involved in cell wall biosynthesis